MRRKQKRIGWESKQIASTSFCNRVESIERKRMKDAVVKETEEEEEKEKLWKK